MGDRRLAAYVLVTETGLSAAKRDPRGKPLGAHAATDQRPLTHAAALRRTRLGNAVMARVHQRAKRNPACLNRPGHRVASLEARFVLSKAHTGVTVPMDNTAAKPIMLTRAPTTRSTTVRMIDGKPIPM